MSNERRHYSRVAFHSPAQLRFGEQAIDVAVLDLSLKGALLRLPEDRPLPVAASCTLTVPLDESDNKIRMEATLSHVDGRYAGLTCHGIDLDSITHLRRVVELNLGTEELLERELSALLAE